MNKEDRIVYPGQIYRHFKGKLYQIITIAIHSETLEPLVIYQQLYGKFKTYARPYKMFISKVDKNKYPNANQIYRFELVSEIELETNNETSAVEKTLEDVVEKIEETRQVSEVDNNLIRFLDADTYEEKRNVLISIKNHLTNRLIDDLAASMDVTVDAGDLEARYKSLMNCIETRLRFECDRLR